MKNWPQKLHELEGKPRVLVTVVRSEGSTLREVGAKLIALSSEKFYGTIGGGQLERLALAHIPHVLSTNESELLKLPLGPTTGQCCGGMVELLFEPVQCGPRLFIFGAGHVGQALTQVIADTPFEAFVIDQRQNWIESEAIAPQTERVRLDPVLFATAAHDWQRTFIVILTHDHALDEKLVEEMAHKPCAYLGLIGSRTKWKRFSHRLTQKGLTQKQLNKVHCPIGLNIGPGKSPKEVALSIGAELLKEYYEKNAEIPADSSHGGKVQTLGTAQRLVPHSQPPVG